MESLTDTANADDDTTGTYAREAPEGEGPTTVPDHPAEDRGAVGEGAKLRGGHDPRELGKRGGKRSGETRRKRREASSSASGRDPAGSVEPLGERDEARQALLAILRNPHAGENAKVSAARALMDAGVDPTAEERTGLEHLTNRALADLLLALPEA